MTDPWIAVEEYHDPDFPGARGYPESAWQGMFACQVEILPHQEWIKLKWGMNAFFLLDESLERQRLFLESQYVYPDEFGLEARDLRTLAYRFIHRPAEGLVVAVIGKIHARTEADAREAALSYLSHLKSTFPYDYPLRQADNQVEFQRLVGEDILENNPNEVHMAALKRMEFCANPNSKSPYLPGFWRSAPHAHEQIWRSLASASSPLLLNITLRSTVLYEEERNSLLKMSRDASAMDKQPSNQTNVSPLKQWEKDTLEHRLAPWKKLFYLQVHLASGHKLSEHLMRAIGTSLTLIGKGEPLPGYQVTPPRQNEVQIWGRKLKNLDLIFSDSFLAHPRLSEVADLSEVFEVMQLPYYPPDNGFPDVSFVPAKKNSNQDGA